MKLGLGIDAGGTFTDAVIYDFESKEVLYSAKANTQKEDLKLGIKNAIDNLPEDTLNSIKLVSLSTTLATNACVEGKGGRPILILIGCDSNTVTKYGHEYGLPAANDIIFIEGGHTHDGDIKDEPDWDMLKEKVLINKTKADAFAVVELSGIMNPEYEIKAKEMIEELTGLPVVYGSEVSRVLNFMKRAASTFINAQLIPLIAEFLDAVKAILELKNIIAPVVVVRGDGSLMSEEYTRKMPVETLLSGPAASVIGAVKLSGKENCIVADMGGTTTDLALVEGGRIKFAHKGVSIGKWQTGTKSIMVKPVGLGGDSLVTYDKYGELTVSPVRAAPLSWLSFKWPHVLNEMKHILAENKVHTYSLCEFFYLIKDVTGSPYYNKDEKSICEALKDGPLSIMKLSEKVDASIYTLQTKRLEQHGAIMRSALTPTDIMHIRGDFTGWDIEGAKIGAQIMANRLNMSLSELVSAVNTKVKEKLYINIVKLMMEEEDESLRNKDIPEEVMNLIIKGFYKNDKEYMKVNLSTDYTIVGIGAPSHVFMDDTAKVLNTECIVPEHAGVANAVGAITGDVVVEESVIIQPIYDAGGIREYSCYSSARMKKFIQYDEALSWAKDEAEANARKVAEDRESGSVSVIVDVREKDILTDQDAALAQDEGEGNAPRLLLETTVTARAIGTIKWS